MFLAWCVLSGLGSDALLSDLKREVARLKSRTITPGAFFLASGESLLSNQLTDLGNAFAAAYYNGKKNDSRYSKITSERFGPTTTHSIESPIAGSRSTA